MKQLFIYTILLFTLVSCEKETSLEGDGNTKYAAGTLLDSANNCKNIIVNGSYRKDSVLTPFNNIVVNVTFTAVGNFTIYSDTVNGYYFYLKGYAYATGPQLITLAGTGKPLANVDAHFTLHFDGDICHFISKTYTQVIANGTANDYFPTTNFSTWVYDNNIINDTSVTKVLGLDKNIFGNNFRKFLLQIPKLALSDTLYYRKDGFGNYYQYDTVGTGPKVEYQILKDYATVGATWESPVVTGTYNAAPTDVKYLFTLTRKNVKRTIGANTIDSIMVVQAETQYNISGTFTTTNTIEYSYAKKIGLVQVKQTGAVLNLNSNIRNWQVN